ncbi:MAG: NAD-dependent epimerase/dehydratase family protein [Myxococcales bacterium]|nr:NAD-dependent epimerase/dehydratase family protein [Myxococcales bacterium]
MKLFVTGGTGFLGQWVIQFALEAGHNVRALVRDAHAKLPPGVEAIVGNLSKADQLTAGINGCDAVIHLAGKVSRHRADSTAMHEVHIQGTRTLISAMTQVGVQKLVMASTSGTIGIREHRQQEPVDETYQPNFELLGRFPYYTSKLYQEQEALRRHDAGDVKVIILNPSLLLGPGDQRLTSTTDVLDILQRRVPAVSSGTMAIVDVRDAAPMFVRALAQGRPGDRYLLNGANMTVRSFAQRVGVAGDVAAPTIKLGKTWAIRSSKWIYGLYEAFEQDPPFDPVAVEMSTLHWDVDATKAHRELNFVPRDPQLTIEATVRDLEARGLFRRT